MTTKTLPRKLWLKSPYAKSKTGDPDGARNKANKDSEEEKHVCPLQCEIIRRLVLIYTNPASIQPGVQVLDPFMGIGSTGFIALGGSTSSKLTVGEPRNVVGFELKESYHRSAVKNCEKAMREVAKGNRTLFDKE